jgi:2-oxoglutarate ferredoxin oxidoreductase subunit beta
MKTNEIGCTRKDYEGVISTLCAGCGHDSITASIIQAAFELSIEPHKVAKLSGIGCSSKTPAYFLNQAHGFNSVHGRMPSIATGANLANRDLTYIGVSGDGDTASIGIGQFVHVARRNLNMLYIVENNGCYGLTKGQDSATADIGSKNKGGLPNEYAPVNLVDMALSLGATFVARSFSGDKKQLLPLIKAGLAHKGFAFIDILSPCVTFNNNPGSTKSYEHVRQHMAATGKMDFIPEEETIETDYDPGTSTNITLHDGSSVNLHKLSEDYDPTNKRLALTTDEQYKERGEILTGLIYVDPESKELHEALNSSDTPLRELEPDVLCPDISELEAINQSTR